MNARAVALRALRTWRTSRRNADEIFGEVISTSSPSRANDRAFALELFYGVLRNLYLLDFFISELRREKVDVDLRDILRLGLYQLMIADVPKHAAVNESVELAPKRLRAVANAILRNAIRQGDDLLGASARQALAVRTSHPDFIVQRWQEEFGFDETEQLCRWNNEPPPIYARINSLKIDIVAFKEKYRDAISGSLPNFVEFAAKFPTAALEAGECYVQDPSTRLACELLDPQPNEFVLDACAAPGGKTSYLAELMRNQGSIVALDRQSPRLEILEQNLARLGVKTAKVVRHDWTDGPMNSLGEFDRVLVDAPCSNTGVLRRRVDARWRLRPNEFARMAQMQLSILRNVAPLLKAGGTLVYSTCSLEPEENERVVAAFTREMSIFQLETEKRSLPFRDGFDGAYVAKVNQVIVVKRMHDPRFDKLAKLLVEYSTRLQRGEKVLIDVFDAPDEMAIALVRAAQSAGAIPFAQIQRARVNRAVALGATEPQLTLAANHELARMKKMDAYIAIRGSDNITELSDVPPPQLKLVAKKMRPVMDQRVKKTKWVVLRWPSPSMAQLAGMSTEAFEDFYFDVCTLDYRKLRPGMNALKAMMERTDRVEIKGPGTDLRFSIKGISAIICAGDRNIPDGEVFSCPVRDSVQGHVMFNVPTVYQGTSFDGIRLEFRDGKVVKATSNDPKKLNEILDADAGARYIGEFSLGCNPRILEPMRDILFDEKIAGSFHFTPGQAYEEADNGNRSQVHWDMVCIQRPEYGGGEVYFDGKLVRRNGKFLPKQLRSLNSR